MLICVKFLNKINILKYNLRKREINLNKILIVLVLLIIFPSCEIKAEENKPPTITKIIGITEGKINTFYNYTFYSTDPNGDDLYYMIHWGDGTVFNWLGPYKSGEEITISYCFFIMPNMRYDEFVISARAKDICNECGEWGHLRVFISSNKIISNNFEKFKFVNNWLNIIKIIINI